MNSVREQKRRIIEDLSRSGIEKHEAAAEAEIIIEFACGYNRLQQMSNAQELVAADAIEIIDRVLRQRHSRMPLQYCLGYGWFMGRKFTVRPGVLIPRSDTETLVDVVASVLKNQGMTKCRIGEIGIGSGIISISLLILMPDIEVIGCDIEKVAVQVAEENAVEHGVSSRFHLKRGDWKIVLPDQLDVIVSNPPYIPTSQKTHLQPEVQKEPAEALFAGVDGLDFYRDIAQAGKAHLRGGRGFAFVEIGDGQAKDVVDLFSRNNWTQCDVHNDVNGLPRVVSAFAP